MTDDLDRISANLRASGTRFAVATVVRTVDATSVKPGAKAFLGADGALLAGWIGGACATSAIRVAARDALADGSPRFISLRPEDLLQSEGVSAGEERDGIRFARNGCPSRGSMDVFVEPVLPRPRLTIFGESPVARALADLAGRFDFDTAHSALPGADMPAADYVVVATQGKGDL
ncbi:MAG: XdhC family protein, partial [Pseudomonadota bacterium]